MVATALTPDVTLDANEEYSVQQVAAITGMSEHNLRYYERAGLLAPVRRDPSSRHRRYTRADITLLENLACLRATGMPLEQMREYVADRAKLDPEVAQHQVALFEAHRAVLEARRAQIERNLRYLELKVAYWRAVEARDENTVAECARLIRVYTQENTQRKK